MEIYCAAIRSFLHSDVHEVTEAAQAKWPTVSAKTRCLLETTAETDSMSVTIEIPGRTNGLTLEAPRLVDGFLAAYSPEEDYLVVARIVPK